jgi:hypothetical protein
VVRALGAQTAGSGGVGQAGDLSLTLLHDGEVEDAHQVVNNAATDALALALAGHAGAVALGALLQEQAHALVGQHTLSHAEALLVVAACKRKGSSAKKKK